MSDSYAAGRSEVGRGIMTGALLCAVAVAVGASGQAGSQSSFATAGTGTAGDYCDPAATPGNRHSSCATGYYCGRLYYPGWGNRDPFECAHSPRYFLDLVVAAGGLPPQAMNCAWRERM